MKTWMRTWIGHTIRIEKDASITWRTPKGRVIRREVSARLAESLRASKGKFKLDLSHTPLKLRNLASTRELASRYVLNRELSSLSDEEWDALVVNPEEPAAFKQVLLFDPETVETWRSFCGFPVRALLQRTSEGVWDWVPTSIYGVLADDIGLVGPFSSNAPFR